MEIAEGKKEINRMSVEMGQKIKIKWDYGGEKANGFFVFIYNFNYEFSSQKASEVIKKHNLSDQNIIDKLGEKISLEEKDSELALYFCSIERYQQQKRQLIVDESDFSLECPKIAKVYAVYCKKSEGKITLFNQEGENEILIPMTLQCKVKHRKKLFTKKQIYSIKIPVIENYENGWIRYCVNTGMMKIDYPITKECCGKEFYVVVPRDYSISIKAKNENMFNLKWL